MTKMREMIVMTGIPKSGKSTIVNNLLKEYQIICADDIRLAMGTQFDVKLEGMVWAIHNIMLEAALMRGINVVIDSTNTMMDVHKRYSKLARGYGYDYKVCVVNVPLQECLNRNEQAYKDKVPEDVIRRMHRQFLDLIEMPEFLKFNIQRVSLYER